MKKTLLTAAALFLMVGSAHAFTTVYSSTGNNFTMLAPDGSSDVGGNNTTAFDWDGTFKTVSNGVANATISSTSKFYTALWTAHNLEILAPGSYSWDTAIGGGNYESGIMNLNVGPGQLGAHLLFDWHGNMNSDVVQLWNINQVWQDPSGQGDLSGFNDLYEGGTNTTTTVFNLSSVDGDGDGVNGIAMAAGGPFAGFEANFNIKGICDSPSCVPEPASMLLIGSGLAGLVGLAKGRRRAH